MRLGLLLALAASLIAAPVRADLPAGSPAPPPSDWAYTLELYGYLPWLQSTTSIRGFETDTAVGPGQLLEHLQFAFSGRASAEKGRLGLLLDGAYTNVAAEPSRTTRQGRFTGNSQLTAVNGVYDLALRWRFGDRESALGQPGRWWVIPYAGMRLVQARLDVAAELLANGPLGLSLERQGTLDRTWVQPLLGTQASVFLSPRLRLFARGDIGGFGLAGEQDLSGNAQVGLGYAIGNNTDLNVSWRYQGLRWANGASRGNGFTSDQNGIELGLKFFF